MTTFAIPDGARAERRAVLLEWPRGSGRVAFYTAAEQEMLAPFLAAGLAQRRGSDGRLAAAREVEHLHDLKVEFGVDLAQNDGGAAGEPTAPPGTPS